VAQTTRIEISVSIGVHPWLSTPPARKESVLVPCSIRGCHSCEFVSIRGSSAKKVTSQKANFPFSTFSREKMKRYDDQFKEHCGERLHHELEA
jgi:hypothetical protein